MGGRVLAVIAAAALAQGACRQLSSKKLPEVPTANTDPVSVTHKWWQAGDRACPSMEVERSTGGPPGANIVPGRVYGAEPPGGDRVWCAAGVDHGMSTTFHPNGARANQGEYVLGVQQGIWVRWYANGQMESRGTYTDGAQTGVWEYWAQSGAPTRRGTLDQGKRVGMWIDWEDDAAAVDDPDEWTLYGGKGKAKRSGVFRDGEPIETHPLCVVGIAPPECQLILLADFTVRATPNADATSSKAGNSKLSYPLELGGIYNFGERHGIGLSAGYNFADEYSGFAVRARYRMWMGRYFGLDLGYGALWARDGLEGANGRGSSAFIALSGADLLSLVVEVQRYDAGDGLEYATHLGLRIGAPVMVAILYILAHVGK
jgi:hypothetical protein